MLYGSHDFHVREERKTKSIWIRSMERAVHLLPRMYVASTYTYHATIAEDRSSAYLQSGDVAVHIHKILWTFRQKNRKGFLTTLKEKAVRAPLRVSVGTSSGNVYGKQQISVALLQKLINTFVSVKCVTWKQAFFNFFLFRLWRPIYRCLHCPTATRDAK